MNAARLLPGKGWLAATLLFAVGASISASQNPDLITASSVYPAPPQGVGYAAEFAFDGDHNTRWASGGQPLPAWIQIDLGAMTTFERMTIHWETACAEEYEIQTSVDGNAWKTVLRRTDGQPGKAELKHLAARGRYVRISALKPRGYRHVSIWEVEFPEDHMAARLTSSRQTAAEERARHMRVSLERLTRSGLTDIILAARPVVGEHWYANFGYYAAESKKPYFGTDKLYLDGAKLYRFNLQTGYFTTLLDDPQGGIRDPQVHYAGKKILFSYRRGGSENFHLYEINCDGSSLRQLTCGPFDDIEPSYLPNGKIAFVSSRAKRWVNCWTTQVAILHSCEADGGNVRALSSNNEHDNTPWPLSDGRILYTRWEYVDRSQVHYHHLWTANPDGTGQTVYFGNLHPGVVMIDAKPVPGTAKVVASFSPGHGQTEHAGWIAVVDPKGGPDAQSFVRRVTTGQDFRDPWALTEDAFLAARNNSIVLLDRKGKTLELCTLPPDDTQAGLLAHEPRPVTVREPERVIPPRVATEETTGRFVLANVYEGRNLAGVEHGEIQKLLVLETLPKPINFTGGMEPLSYGGTFTLERILGTVPVENDGSAYFEAPALRSLLFVALDRNDLAVKRMQSFTTLMPGETTGCVGCHEHRVQPPKWNSPGRLQALARPPSRITPIPDVPEVLDFPRDVQPILDRHCLDCHDCDQRQGGVVLSGDHGPHYSLSYFTLVARNQLADGRNRARSNYAPRTLGSGGSSLMQKLEPSHHEVRLSQSEKQTVRLWIDIGAPYPGTYAALGSGMIGGYDQNTLDRSAETWPSTEAAIEAIQRRCASCHTGPLTLPVSVCDEIVAPPWEDMSPIDPRRRFSRHLLYNLSRPEQSPLLLAALANEAGGLSICREPKLDTNSVVAIFQDTTDPDYQAVLAAIITAQEELQKIKRFDMPGFKARPEWVREMKRFGVLPESAQAEDELDVYAIEQLYWKSLWPKEQSNRGHSPG
jgi:hypothetical protein